MDRDNDLYLLLGRLDGKMDALAAMHGTAINRLDQLETRMGATEQDVATIKATANHGRQWIATGISIVAVAVSAVAIYFGA